MKSLVKIISVVVAGGLFGGAAHKISEAVTRDKEMKMYVKKTKGDNNEKPIKRG